MRQSAAVSFIAVVPPVGVYAQELSVTPRASVPIAWITLDADPATVVAVYLPMPSSTDGSTYGRIVAAALAGPSVLSGIYAMKLRGGLCRLRFVAKSSPFVTSILAGEIGVPRFRSPIRSGVAATARGVRAVVTLALHVS